MTYPRKFFLNLTSNSISLVMEQYQEQKVLHSFDPNEPAANEELKKLFHCFLCTSDFLLIWSVQQQFGGI